MFFPALREMWKDRRSRTKRADHEAAILAENARRHVELEKWLAKNPLKLCFNTIKGIMAVMPPASYGLYQAETEAAIIDGEWDHPWLLAPSHRVHLFARKQGVEILARHGITVPSISELCRWCHIHKVQSEWREDIFVPWIDENFSPFSGHKHAPAWRHDWDMKRSLLNYHTPRHLQPVTNGWKPIVLPVSLGGPRGFRWFGGSK